MAELTVVIAYVILLSLLFVYVTLQFHLSIHYRRSQRRAGRESVPPAASADADLPFVTVQLPVYNEMYVATRVLDQTAALDWPSDRLEIQVLDDSTDETRELLARRVAELQRHGHQVRHLHREARIGFKAGALRDGMRTAKGEFIAVFDADFLPPSNFLRQTIPYFADGGVAAVQTRWAHLNASASMLTHLQAFMLDTHFTVEQRGRAAAGCFINFNGTAGVWRASAIHDAGGWRSTTLTEDVDLSYRAQLRGWRIEYLEDVTAPAELPVEMAGVRSQQFRWMKGGAQNARLHFTTVISAPLPRHVRTHACAHLLSSSVYLLLLGVILFAVPLSVLKNTHIQFEYVHFGLPFFASTCLLGFTYYTAQRACGGVSATPGRLFVSMILFLVFTMGLALHNAWASLEGWAGRASSFVRTPKYGVQGHTHWTRSRYARRTVGRFVWAEAGLLVYVLLGLAAGWRRGEFALFPILSMAALGIGWVIGLTVRHAYHARYRAGRGLRSAGSAGAA